MCSPGGPGGGGGRGGLVCSPSDSESFISLLGGGGVGGEGGVGWFPPGPPGPPGGLVVGGMQSATPQRVATAASSNSSDQRILSTVLRQSRAILSPRVYAAY